MPLLINLRHLEQKNLELRGELDVEELDLDPGDELVHVHDAPQYDLQVQKLEQSLLIQGRLKIPLRCECARCLKAFDQVLELENWTCHIPLAGEDKATVVSDCVDLTPYIREDTLLAFPQHPLCETECRGLAQPASARTSLGASAKPSSTSSAWDELNKLKL